MRDFLTVMTELSIVIVGILCVYLLMCEMNDTSPKTTHIEITNDK